MGLASGLVYLHEEWERCVVHRDIKPSNIMLDSSFNVKLGDFGLAHLMGHELGAETTVLAGTGGYMAPEYISTRKASKESDVYSFGVVAFGDCHWKETRLQKKTVYKAGNLGFEVGNHNAYSSPEDACCYLQ
ncbi:L-type lectin-domain containing receptor kinase IX.1 [Ancistrocladus abbreviatus]